MYISKKKIQVFHIKEKWISEDLGPDQVMLLIFPVIFCANRLGKSREIEKTAN
jgi:hypothetical protein